MEQTFLKIEVAPPYRLLEWYLLRKDIEFSPPYQRKGNIWRERDRAFLIDSILNGYDIPKFYLADFSRSSGLTNENSKTYAIIDGKQRFHAIFEFFANDLRLNRDFVWRYDPSLELGGKTFDEILEINESVINVFEKYVITVMSVATDDEKNVHELFRRLNRGRSLTGAEVRNAALGPVADLVRRLGKHPFFAQSVKFSTLRMNDLNAAAKLLLFEVRSYPTSTKKKDLDALYEGDISERVLAMSGAEITDNLNKMAEIFEPHDELLSASGQIPAFYWFIKLCHPASTRWIRSFLARFALDRMQTRKDQAANRLDRVNAVLARYDVLDRNTNDAGSHRARIAILLDLFAKYLEQRGEPLASEQAEIADRYAANIRVQFEMEL